MSKLAFLRTYILLLRFLGNFYQVIQNLRSISHYLYESQPQFPGDEGHFQIFN